MLISAMVMFLLMAEEPKAPKDGEKPPEVSLATNDPFDGRHVEVTAWVDASSAKILDVQVRPGEAHALFAGSSRLRVGVLDGGGRLVQESGFPNPLAQRLYVSSAPPSGEPQYAVIGTLDPLPAGVRPHEVVTLNEAKVTILLPLRSDLATVSLGWRGGPSHDVDFRDPIRKACSQDAHPVCRAWLEVNP